MTTGAGRTAPRGAFRLAAVALLFAGAGQLAAQATSTAERIRQVETGLLPSVQVRGRTYQPVTLAERMRQLRVPAVSIAVIHDGQLEWAKAYGLADVAAETPATTGSLFQAASMSKPVAAMGALELVEEGRLTLDGDVNTWLRSWHIPQDSFTARQPVTLTHLLTHSAGLTVHGFPGYVRGAPVPSLVQVLNGTPPANTGPIRVDQPPGKAWRYSGGGFTVMQQLVEDVTGEPFPAYMERAVLRPLGMSASTYQQPLPDSLAARAATAYTADGRPVEGRFHTYPEMAAAGLWTTASDLARWVMAVQRTYAGTASPVLSRAMVTEMLRARIGGWGLGLGVRPAGDDVVFEHGGANSGYRGNFFGLVNRGEGAVVLTNSDAGGDLVSEVLQALARTYGWAAFPVREIVPTAVPPELLQACVGEYQLGAVRASVTLEGGALFAVTPDGARSELVPVGGDWFVVALSGQRIRAERDASGRVVALAAGGVRLPRVR